MKQSDTLSMCICINVSRANQYNFKIPPNIKSVPTIMDQNGQILTGSFARNFITTVLPQMKTQDPMKQQVATHPSQQKPVTQIQGQRPSASTSTQSNQLQSANFGTEFSGFSYLPGANDLGEDFIDFGNIKGDKIQAGMGVSGGGGNGDPRTAVSASMSGGSKKSQELQQRLDAMKEARSEDMRRR